MTDKKDLFPASEPKGASLPRTTAPLLYGRIPRVASGEPEMHINARPGINTQDPTLIPLQSVSKGGREWEMDKASALFMRAAPGITVGKPLAGCFSLSFERIYKIELRRYRRSPYPNSRALAGVRALSLFSMECPLVWLIRACLTARPRRCGFRRSKGMI